MPNWRDHVMTGERRQQVEASEWVSARVAGHILGVSSRRVLQLVAERAIPCVTVDDGYCGQFIFKRAEVAQVAQAGRPRRKRGAKATPPPAPPLVLAQPVEPPPSAPRATPEGYEVVWGGVGPSPGEVRAREAWQQRNAPMVVKQRLREPRAGVA